MIVILNSDILHGKWIFNSLPTASVKKLLEVCANKDIPVLLPRTTILEFEHMQIRIREKIIAEIEKAYSTLGRYHVQVERENLEDKFKVPDLPSVLEGSGVRVLIEEPNLSDFEEAHRRACLHIPPVSKEKKSDEMRDVIIWLISLRISEEYNGGILIANDEFFHNEAIDREAIQYKLDRVKRIEDAIERLGEITVAGRIIRDLFYVSHDYLFDSEMKIKIDNVTAPIFTNDDWGNLRSAEANIAVTDSDKNEKTMFIRFELDHGHIKFVVINDQTEIITKKINVEYEKPISEEYNTALESLRSIIGG